MTLVDARPAAGTPREWSFPRFDRRSVHGHPVVAAHLPGRPLGVASLIVPRGAGAELPGQEGVSGVLADALSEGTRRRGAHEFAVACERLGASLDARSDWDSFRVRVDAPAARLDAAVELLAEAVREPGLDDAAVERVRQERVDELAIDRSQPAARAAEGFAAAVFAPGSRYSLPEAGTLASLAGLDAGAVREFHPVVLDPAAATLVVVGDLDEVDVDALAGTVFDGWTAAPASPAPLEVVAARRGRRVVVVDRPGSVQSMLYVGHDGPARSMPDYVAATTMSMVLGGMFSSRLNLNLREDKGYTYGAFCGFDARRDGGTFTARAAVQSEVTVPALAETVREIERMHAGGVGADELAQARDYRAGVFPVTFSGVGAVANGLGDLVVHGWPDDHFDRLRADVLAVTTGELDAAAAARLAPGEIVTVVVGDAGTVRDGLADSGLGPVEVVADTD